MEEEEVEEEGKKLEEKEEGGCRACFVFILYCDTYLYVSKSVIIHRI